MKKFLFLALGALCGSTLAAKEPPGLLMPDEILSVQGIETNVYFANVFKTVNPDNYFFQVSCPKGKLMKKFWTVTPEKKDIGTYSWKLTVFDDNGKVAEKTVKLKILPQKKIPENLSILMIGDSWTDQSYYVHRLKKLAPALNMIGSNGGLGKDPAKTGIAHEGYGGWTWGLFALERKPVPPGTMPYRTNKFLVEKNGRWSHDFDAYFAKYSNGKKPDFVTIGLGPNDIYALTDENIDNALIRIGKSMDKLIGEIRKSVPDAFIGITLFTITAGQDAWGKAYGCRSNSYQFKKNLWKLNQFYMDKISQMSKTDKKISIIPMSYAVDSENGYPVTLQVANIHSKKKIFRQSNALHPSAEGYAQAGDVYYCWLLNCLSQENK